MRTGFGRHVVLALAFAASGFALAGDKGADSRKVEPPGRGALPKLPPGTLPPVSLPSDPTGSKPGGTVAKANLDVPGTIQPASEVSVTPQVSGQVTKVLVEEGDVVKTGQVLATLDHTKADLELRKAEARLKRAEAVVSEAEAGVSLREGELKKAVASVKQAAAMRNYAQKKLDRLKDLLRHQAIEQSIVDEAESQLQAVVAQEEQANVAVRVAQAAADRAKARVATAKAEVAAAQAERDLAKWAVEAAEIRAPAAGTVVVRRVRVGDGVGPILANGRPTPLFDLADLTQLTVLTHVPERNRPGLTVGQKCEVRVDAVPSVVYRGTVSWIAPVVSEQDRTAAVRMKLDVPKDAYRPAPGMYGAVRILGKD